MKTRPETPIERGLPSRDGGKRQRIAAAKWLAAPARLAIIATFCYSKLLILVGKMTNEQLAIVANILQLSVIAISLVAFIPQWRRILRTKSSEGISHCTWYLWNVATIFGFIYALINYHITGWGMSLIVATGVNVVFRMITLTLVIIFQVKSRATESEANISQPTA